MFARAGGVCGCVRAVWRRGKREDHFFPFFVMVMEVGEPGFGEVEDFAMLLIVSARAPGEAPLP